MSAPYYGLSMRNINLVSAKRFEPDAHFRRVQDTAEGRVAEPFTGVTTDGNIVPSLYALAPTGVSTEPIRRAALQFIDTLNSSQRAQVTFDIDSDKWRRWWNIHAFLMRHGLLLEDATDNQRAAALGVLEQTLSDGGYRTARDIMRLNHTIGELTNDWDAFGEYVYFLSIFGQPSESEPWGWQIDGHHLIVNCFMVGDQVVVTPMFMGSEPVTAETGKYRGTSVLQSEQTQARELMQSLSASQRDKAIPYDSADKLPSDRQLGSDGRIHAAAFRDNMHVPYEGIPATLLTPGQCEQLLRLIEVYTGRLRPGHAEVWLNAIRRQLDETHFMWMGGTDGDAVFYYRIHSPVILIEFDHQPGVCFDSNAPTPVHIHTVTRSPNGNDYGRDYLRQHYARFPHVNGEHSARA
jgi:hypothetical protein